MPITTDNGKFAVMEWDQDYEPGLPLSPGAFGQDDQQQLLWGIPEILWGEPAAPDATGPTAVFRRADPDIDFRRSDTSRVFRRTDTSRVFRRKPPAG